MSNSKDREIHRKLEMIARIRPSQESTSRAMDAVRQQLLAQQQTAPAPDPTPRIISILSQPWMKIGIAAVILIGLGLGILLNPNPSEPLALIDPEVNPVNPVIKAGTLPGQELTPVVAALSAEELAAALAHMDYEAADMNLPWLRQQLDSPHEPIRVAAATYLSQLGDQQDVEPLQMLAGNQANNPYAEALTILQDRLDPNTSRTENAAQGLPLAGGSVVAQGCLSGVIRDALTSQPVPDVTVELHGPVIYQTLADSNGFYSFGEWVKPGTYGMAFQSLDSLGFTQPQEMPSVALDPNTSQQRHFYLDRGCMVEVYVTDETGQPVQDAKVQLSWLGQQRANNVGQSDLTNIDGRAIVGAVKPSDTPYQACIIHSQLAPSFAEVLCTDPNELATVTVILPQGQSLPGTAVYRDGTPAEGLRMSAVPTWWHSQGEVDSVVVEPNGSFVLPYLLEGSYNLMAAYEINKNSWICRSVGILEYPFDDEVLACTVPFESPQSQVDLSGTIDWTTQEQTDQIAAMAIHTQGIYLKPLIVEGNQFVMDQLKPGTYSLIVEGPHIRPTLFEDVTVPQSDFVMPLAYEPLPHLEGQIVDAETELPISDFKISLQKQKPLLLLLKSRITPVINTDGLFDIPTQGPGIYRVQILADGYLPYDMGRIDTDDFSFTTIALTRGGTLTGRIVNAEGQPIDGATLSLMVSPSSTQLTNGWTEQVEMTAITSQGRYTLKPIPFGTHKIEVSHPDYATKILDQVDVSEGQIPTSLDITLDAQ